jgi:hypothetical protein
VQGLGLCKLCWQRAGAAAHAQVAQKGFAMLNVRLGKHGKPLVAWRPGEGDKVTRGHHQRRYLTHDLPLALAPALQGIPVAEGALKRRMHAHSFHPPIMSPETIPLAPFVTRGTPPSINSPCSLTTARPLLHQMFLAAYKFLDAASHSPQQNKNRLIAGSVGVCFTLALATWNSLRKDVR